MNKTRVTVMLDASALRESGCILRLHRIVVGGYSKGIMPNDVTYGTGFHEFRKLHKLTGKLMPSINAGVELYKTIPKFIKRNKQYLTEAHLRKTCLDYVNWWDTMETFTSVKDVTGLPLVEQKFAVPLLVDTEGDIEVEVLGAGTIDDIVQHNLEGFLAVKDYKTTAVWDTKKYLNQYRLSTQLMFYVYILKKYGQFFPNGIIGKITKQPIGAFIDGIFLAAEKETTFERSEVYFYSEKQLQDFEKGLNIIIARLVASIRNPALLYKEGTLNGSCEKVYGACSYADVCGSPDEESAELMLDNNFVRKPYNPLKFGEE